MCSKATCRACGKTTWAGCGQHVPQVMARVPRAEQCTCTDAGQEFASFHGYLEASAAPVAGASTDLCSNRGSWRPFVWTGSRNGNRRVEALQIDPSRW